MKVGFIRTSKKDQYPELQRRVLMAFGRSLCEIIDLVNASRERGVEFASLRASIETTTPGGKLVFHGFGAVAEFERDLIPARSMEGLEAARA